MSNLIAFKQLNIDRYLKMPYNKPILKEIKEAVVDAKIKSSYVIKTLKGESSEGQILTGYKLIFHGSLYISLEYVEDTYDEALHFTSFDIPFSSFIILPIDYELRKKINIEVIIENVDTSILNMKEISIGVSILFILNKKLN